MARPKKHIETTGRADFAALEKECDDLLRLQPGWDSYDAEPPNDVAVGNAKKLLRILEHNGGPLPTDIGPTVVNGVSLVFSSGANYVDVECYNNGEVLLGNRRPDGSVSVHPLNVEDAAGSVRCLRDHLRD